MAAVTLSGNLSSSLAPSTCTVLFVLGGLAGFVHGGILGHLGRDTDRPATDTLLVLLVGALILLPTAPLAWLASLLVAMSSASIISGEIGMQLGAVAGWTAALFVCAWAAWEGWQALARAFERWPERRAGTLIMLGILAILGLSFFLNRPVIWGTDLQVRGLGAIILALGATIWIALPVVLVALHVVHRIAAARTPTDASSPLEPDPRT